MMLLHRRLPTKATNPNKIKGHKYKHKAGMIPHPQPWVAPSTPKIVPITGIPPTAKARMTEITPFHSNTSEK